MTSNIEIVIHHGLVQCPSGFKVKPVTRSQPVNHLGLAKGRDGGPMINDGSMLCPGAINMINVIISKCLRENHLAFSWTSLQINCNTVADWHQDSNNVGTSAMLVGGHHSGGSFEVEGLGRVDLAGKLCFFDGHLWHRSHAFSGDRFSVVAFTHSLTDSCSSAARDSLVQLGFGLPQTP